MEAQDARALLLAAGVAAGVVDPDLVSRDTPMPVRPGEKTIPNLGSRSLFLSARFAKDSNVFTTK